MICEKKLISYLLILILLACISLSGCAEIRSLTGEPVESVTDIAAIHTFSKGDDLREIARKADIGIIELLAANPDVDPDAPAEGTRLVLPIVHTPPDGPRRGIVVNLAQLRLFYFTKTGDVMSFPIAIGRDGWETRTGKTTIIKKRKDPTWIPPPSILKEYPELPSLFAPGLDNPLGAYALSLGWPGYVIHGTNQPYSVGLRSSHGCIRLYPEDIKVLFEAVEEGTPVTIVNQGKSI